MVLSHDTSSCSCRVVALSHSDAMLALLLCVSTPVMRAAVCPHCVSAVRRCRDAVLHVCASRLSFAVCICCVVVVVVCRALVCTCMASLSSRCDLHYRRCVAGLSSGMTASGTCWLSGCIVFWVTRTRRCV